jgi:hypothetical protein
MPFPLFLNEKPTSMGRFHYWLGTSQVTKFGLVLHRPPFDISFGWQMAMISFLYSIQ